MKWKPMMLAAPGGTFLSAQALAATTVRVVEVITSPPRTEFLKKQFAAFEQANPDIKVELISLPWGQAFEKFLTMVQAGDTPDVVEMPERWVGLYGGNGQLEDLDAVLQGLGGLQDARRPRQGARLHGQPHALHGALRLLHPGHVLEQKAV